MMDWNTVLFVAKVLGVISIVSELAVMYATGKFLWITRKGKKVKR
jgi:hypothetical protein